jgi:hypothetical protein
MDINNEITQALFDMYDIKNILEDEISQEMNIPIKKLPKDFDGTDITIGDCINNVISILECLEEIHEPPPDVFKPKLYLVKEET